MTAAARNMHSHIQVVLDHPMFTDETRKIMMLLVSGIHNGEWLKDTVVFGTPERGCKIISQDRTIESNSGYYEIYVHDYYVDIFIQPSLLSNIPRVVVSRTLTEETWDTWSVGFDWARINVALSAISGVHSRR